MLNLPAAGWNAKQDSLFLEMLICREQSTILSVTFGDALRCFLKQEITKFQWLSCFWALPSALSLSFPTIKWFLARVSTCTHMKGRLIHREEGFFPPPHLYELLYFIHFSYISPYKCTKTNIHCNIYERSLIVTAASKKTGKMNTKRDGSYRYGTCYKFCSNWLISFNEVSVDVRQFGEEHLFLHLLKRQ